MKAIVCTQYGPPDVLRLEDVPRPVAKDDEVLIEVRAASVNSWDWELLHGTPFANRVGGLFKPKYQILGADVAGRVTAVGRDVKRFQPGDEVYGDLCRSGWGGFAECVCAREEALAFKPSAMTFEQAAAVPQAGCMAVQGLRDLGRIRPGQRVLINGAGGGVGTFAVQIAKSFDTEVTGVDSTKKLDLMRAIGADHVLDYAGDDYTRNGQAYDLILDVAMHRSVFDYRRALSPTGTFVVVGGATSRIFQLMLLGRWATRGTGQKMTLLLAKPNLGLDYLQELFEAGKVTPVIERSLGLTEVAEALRHLGAGHALGKLVVTM
jgi:NADPH:quinone reductase-like Zn-dependent oxidoreductase